MSLDATTYHVPVLLEESVNLMDIRPDGTYCDLTFGGGGHSRHILSKLGEGGRLFSFDQDRDTLANAPDDEHFNYVESNFRFLRGALRLRGVEQVDGTVVGGACHIGKSAVDIRLVLCVVVRVGKAPVHIFVTQILHDRQRLDGEFTCRMTEQEHFIAEVFLHIIVKAHDLVDHLFHGLLGHDGVIIAVVADDMTLIDHPPHQIRVFLDVISHQKEGGFHIVGL